MRKLIRMTHRVRREERRGREDGEWKGDREDACAREAHRKERRQERSHSSTAAIKERTH